MSITVELRGAETAINRLSKIQDPKLRRSILRKVAKLEVKAAKDRITAQRDLSGAAFKPAADGSGSKLLVGKAKKPGLRKLLKVVEASADSATVGWDNNLLSYIGGRQQYGFTEPSQSRRNKNPLNTTDPASRNQAKALISAGYKVRRRGKALWTPSIKWITQNLNQAQASVILRLIRGTQPKGTVTVPARSFLGVTEIDMGTIGKLLEQEVDAALGGA